MKIIATDIPKTIEDYQIVLNAVFEGGKVYGAAAEREACAKVCEDVEPSLNPIINITNQLAAAAIRARGKK